MPTPEFWTFAGIGVMIFFILLPFALSDKWEDK
jgi:hypothetical protein